MKLLNEYIGESILDDEDALINAEKNNINKNLAKKFASAHKNVKYVEKNTT